MNTATTNAAENAKEENTESKCGIAANIFAGNCIDNSGEINKEMDTNDIDELPAFEIRLISPLGRTPSPIDSEDMATPTRPAVSHERLARSPCNNPEFIALHDINAQISPPSEHGDEDESSLSRTSSLETIFEGVFLNTPPRRLNVENHRHSRSRTSLLEKVAIKRLQAGKENHSPLSKLETNTLSRRDSLDFGCVANTGSDTENGFS